MGGRRGRSAASAAPSVSSPIPAVQTFLNAAAAISLLLNLAIMALEPLWPSTSTSSAPCNSWRLDKVPEQETPQPEWLHAQELQTHASAESRGGQVETTTTTHLEERFVSVSSSSSLTTPYFSPTTTLASPSTPPITPRPTPRLSTTPRPTPPLSLASQSQSTSVKPVPIPPLGKARTIHNVSDQAVVHDWAQLSNSLKPLQKSSLRLIPNASVEARVRHTPFWLVFGMSSVHRSQAEYLGITLSHLFDALGERISDSNDAKARPRTTAIVVHLADFDTNWVERTSSWLSASFSDEVAAGRLHAINAPEQLYTPRWWLWRKKFGDNDDRQWWKSKQNMDYAFLMWYATGLSDYYMQLEDDIQVVPSFLQSVNTFLKNRVADHPWVMVAFSKLGFIGKFFNSSTLPKLAEFLHAFHDEAPCDWLVWVFIDILSPRPVTGEIAEDLEQELSKRVAHARDPNAKLPKAMRKDVLLFYREAKRDAFRSRSSIPEPKPGGETTVMSAGAITGPAYPPAVVMSTMTAWKDNVPDRLYPPGDPRSFWTSDTCWPRPPMEGCDATGKYLEVVFNEPVLLRGVEIAGGADKSPNDYVRNGSLEISATLAPQDGRTATQHGSCVDYKLLKAMTEQRVTWRGNPLFAARCLRIVLNEAQEAWIMLRFAKLEFDTRTTTTTGIPPAASRRASVGEDVAEEIGVVYALLAASLGISAGLAGWVAVFFGWQTCGSGLEKVGEFPCWAIAFMVVLDILLIAVLVPPPPPPGSQWSQEGVQPCSDAGDLVSSPFQPAESATVTSLPGFLGGSIPSKLASQKSGADFEALPINVPTRHLSSASAGYTPSYSSTYSIRETGLREAMRNSSKNASVGLSWRGLRSGIFRLNFSNFWVLGKPPAFEQELDGFASVSDAWLIIGLPVDGTRSASAVADTVSLILQKNNRIKLLISMRNTSSAIVSQSEILTVLQGRFASEVQSGRLQAIRAPISLYASNRLARKRNIDDAVLLMGASSLAQFYMQVEPDALLDGSFQELVLEYVAKNPPSSWHIVALAKLGFNRKIVRTHILPRMAELLIMFPHVPADVLYWDFVDLVSNQSAPKACKIAMDAGQHQRPDVILQYHKAEALIQHVGDVSSLKGKVQRIRDDYFKKHALVDTLFDSPAATLRTSLDAAQPALQAVYGTQPVAGPEHTKMVYSTVGVQRLPAPGRELFFELVFHEPTTVQLVLIRMGAHVRPASKNQKNKELADADFSHTLDEAELQFGTDKDPSAMSSKPAGAYGAALYPACKSYKRVSNASGREVFWRGPQSNPAENIACIRVLVLQPQQKPLVVREIRVRSARGRERKLTATVPLLSSTYLRDISSTSTLTSTSTATSTSIWTPALNRTDLVSGFIAFVHARALAVSTPNSLEAAEVYPGSSGLHKGPVQLSMEQWNDRLLAWMLTVSVAFGSGSLAGVIGCATSRLLPGGSCRRSSVAVERSRGVGGAGAGRSRREA